MESTPPGPPDRRRRLRLASVLLGLGLVMALLATAAILSAWREPGRTYPPESGVLAFLCGLPDVLLTAGAAGVATWLYWDCGARRRALFAALVVLITLAGDLWLYRRVGGG